MDDGQGTSRVGFWATCAALAVLAVVIVAAAALSMSH